jgi:rhamnulokinase
MGLNKSLFAPMTMPGATVGLLSSEIQRLTGAGAIPVIAVAGHDTGSAVASVPADTEHFAYLSSGTWSLMGIETKDPIVNDKSESLNFTNEGGIEGTIRVLKNICGMWLLEECRREWKAQGKEYSYEELLQMAMAEPAFRSFVNPDDSSFAHPESMVDAISNFCNKTGQAVPQNPGQIIRLIFESLALRYRAVLGMLQSLSPHPIEKLYVIGGGARNHQLNQFAANSMRIPVVSGPAEATAIGNIMLQAKAAGIVSSLSAMRAVIATSIESQTYLPQEQQMWEEAYQRFVKL